MLPSRLVIFSAVEGTLLDSASRRWTGAEDALAELERRRVPLVLCTGGTRAQLEPLRTKIGHGHPFITEGGGGLFIPDAYFTMKLEGAHRAGRYFCVPCAKDYAATVAGLAEIAREAGADVLGFSEMTAREIARNEGESSREAERAREREFSEKFFFAGESGDIGKRFATLARERGWHAVPGEPFWQFSSSAGPERAIRQLMRFYQAALHQKLRSVGIGSSAEDLPLLSAVSQRIVLPRHGEKFESALVAGLPRSTHASASGPVGWNENVLDLLAES